MQINNPGDKRAQNMTEKKSDNKKPNAAQTVLSVAACKVTRGALRVAKRGGTALPGKAARVFAKNILEVTSSGMEIIVVTGTNGKTTTARMLEHAMTMAGRDTLANKSGANLLSGITAEFTCDASVTGRPRKKYAIIECDEGALKQVVPLIHPKVIVVTNLFRDQLDRYGEVMHTLEQIRVAVSKVPETTLCLNADDSLTASLALDVPNKVVYFGLDTPVGEQKDVEISDAKYCIRCGTEYQYKYHTYAHLGGFYCPECGYKRCEASTAVTKIEKISPSGTVAKMRSGGEESEVVIGLPAVYNVYNAVAAVCAYETAGYPREEIYESLADVRSSFGRMETFNLDGVSVQMILVKNPAGCNQAIEYLRSMEKPYTAVFCLNDRTADGRDISWIWDADFEKIGSDPNVQKIYVNGDRAEDMQLRLKYADARDEMIELVHDNEVLVDKLRESKGPVFILPNYTSMLALRAALGSATGKQEFWKG